MQPTRLYIFTTKITRLYGSNYDISPSHITITNNFDIFAQENNNFEISALEIKQNWNQKESYFIVQNESTRKYDICLESLYDAYDYVKSQQYSDANDFASKCKYRIYQIKYDLMNNMWTTHYSCTYSLIHDVSEKDNTSIYYLRSRTGSILPPPANPNLLEESPRDKIGYLQEQINRIEKDNKEIDEQKTIESINNIKNLGNIIQELLIKYTTDDPKYNINNFGSVNEQIEKTFENLNDRAKLHSHIYDTNHSANYVLDRLKSALFEITEQIAWMQN